MGGIGCISEWTVYLWFYSLACFILGENAIIETIYWMITFEEKRIDWMYVWWINEFV